MTDTWDKTDINNLLGESEDYKREFKQAGWVIGKPRNIRNDAISKAVSAFANADGGNLILGIEEKSAVAHKVTPLDENIFSKEQLQQIIDHNIQPKIEGLIIHRVEWDATKHEVVYVIEIPRSYMAHQAKDLKYYQRRSGATTEPMTHSEIVDVMGRGQHPKIELEFSLTKKPGIYVSGSSPNEKPLVPEEYILHVGIVNVGSKFAEYYVIFIKLPKILYNALPKGVETVHENEQDYAQHQVTNLENGVHRPLLPQLGKQWNFPIHRLDDINLEEHAIQWEVYVDNAPPCGGSIFLNNIQYKSK